MGEVTVARLTAPELPAFRAFCAEAWGKEHPLIHNEVLFDYYYRRGDRLDFFCAKDADSGEFLSVCGYIPASDGPRPDVWLSFLVSRKGARAALSLRLLEAIRTETDCRTLACNNIRPETGNLYRFFGYTVGALTQYYRLNDSVEEYTLCKIRFPERLPLTTSAAEFRELADKKELNAFAFSSFAENKPYKDQHYAERRYFDNGYIRYRVFLASEAGHPFGLLVLRVFQYAGACAVRVVDYLGDRSRFASCGVFLDRFSRQLGAEFCDCWVYGLPAEVMARAGFTQRRTDDANILPNYLEPPLFENVDFTLFTSDPAGYAMFKADGDQDRANLG